MQLIKCKVYFYRDDPSWYWVFRYFCTKGEDVFDTGHIEVEGDEIDYDTCCAAGGIPLVYVRHLEEFECREATESEIKMLEEGGIPLVYVRHLEEFECREATDSEIKMLEEACK